MTTIIEADRLSLRYEDVTALDEVSFTLTGNKIYGLLGRNGAGKTSLLSVLAGYLPPSGGSITSGGRPVFENADVTRHLCLVRGTGDATADGSTVRDLLRFAGRLRETWDAAFARELVERFEIPLDRTARKLSHGKRSALGIVIGLASRSPVTMFDESHLGLDAPSRYTFYDTLLADVMAHPRTVILSTHLIEEVSTLFEEVLILDRGALMLHEDAESLRGKGSSVTGEAEAVDRFVAGMRVLDERSLGRTKSAMVYGALDDTQVGAARAAGLELGPLALQDLFVHLTEPTGGHR